MQWLLFCSPPEARLFSFNVGIPLLYIFPVHFLLEFESRKYNFHLLWQNKEIKFTLRGSYLRKLTVRSLRIKFVMIWIKFTDLGACTPFSNKCIGTLHVSIFISSLPLFSYVQQKMHAFYWETAYWLKQHKTVLWNFKGDMIE
jgi:hypothetical protein